MALDGTKVVYGISRIFREDYDPTGVLAIPDPDAQVFGDPGATWEELGLTQDYLTFRANTDYADIPADQYPDPVAQVLESRDVGLAGNLIQVTPQNMAYALGFGDVENEAAGVGTRGWDRFTLTDEVSEALAAILVDFQNPGNGEFGRVFMPKARPASSVETTFGNRTEATQIPFDYAALPHDGMTTTTVLDMYIYTPATS